MEAATKPFTDNRTTRSDRAVRGIPADAVRVGREDLKAVDVLAEAMRDDVKAIRENRAPRIPGVAGLREEVMSRRNRVFRTAVRLAFCDIDEGYSLEAVTRCWRRLMTALEQRAASRERVRVLDISHRFDKAWTRETVEQGETDSATIAARSLNDADALARLESELDQEIEAKKVLRQIVMERRLELLALDALHGVRR